MLVKSVKKRSRNDIYENLTVKIGKLKYCIFPEFKIQMSTKKLQRLYNY